MSEQLETFQVSYSAALDRHLAGGGETGLELAYELGREAVTSGLSLLELAGIHHAALSRSLERAAGPADLERIAGLGGDFFLESLSTFEMTQRGFLEVQEKARLEQRHADQLRGLADAALAVNSTLSVDEMLELVAERARALVGARRSNVSIAAENGDAPLASGRDADQLSAPLIDREGRPLGSIWLADKRRDRSATTTSRSWCSSHRWSRSPSPTPACTSVRRGSPWRCRRISCPPGSPTSPG